MEDCFKSIRLICLNDYDIAGLRFLSVLPLIIYKFRGLLSFYPPDLEPPLGDVEVGVLLIVGSLFFGAYGL